MGVEIICIFFIAIGIGILIGLVIDQIEEELTCRRAKNEC